jgi:hypothetical protein
VTRDEEIARQTIDVKVFGKATAMREGISALGSRRSMEAYDEGEEGDVPDSD